MPLLDALDQADALAGVQFGQQFGCLIVTAVEVCLHLIQRVVNIYAPQLVIPAVPSRQPHPVQQQPVQQFGIRGQPLELLAGYQQPGDAVIAESV